MSKRKPLVGNHAVHMIANALRSLGFYVFKKSDNGSRYLRMRGHQFALRLADHPWPSRNYARWDDVVHNVVIAEPIDPCEIGNVAFDIAVAFVFKMRLRLGLVRAGV